MNTKKLYKEDVYLCKCDAIVKKVDGDDVILDQTVFFPEGGGQSCDLGTISNFEVSDVQESYQQVIHKVPGNNFKVGDNVTCEINWDHRFDNMQRHCGEHIMSGMWFREYGGINRGFHMGDNYMTVDISLEEDPKYTEITWEMAQHIEDCTNEAIWQNLPVITRHFDTQKEAKDLPLRKALTLKEDITIVAVGDINNPSDCVACCGTHPQTSGQVGLLKIYKVEKNKGMFRIYFEAGKRAMDDYPSDCVACCGTHPQTSGQVGLLKIYKVEKNKGMFRIYFEAGKRAMDDYDTKHDIINIIGNKYSAGTDDLVKKLDAQEDRYKELKQTHTRLRNSVIAIRQNEILRTLEDCDCANEILLYRYDDMLIDDLLNIGRPLMDRVNKLLLIADDNSNTLLLFSNGDIDCGKLVKENASIYQGKGGGNKNNARAILLLIADDNSNTLLLFSNGDIDCGKLVKENASIYQGKGGGNKNNARAIFPNKDNMNIFIDLIEKHLR